MQGPIEHSLNHLRGALRLFRLETADFVWADTSRAGVIQSFRAAALAFPFWLLLIANELFSRQTDYYAPAVYAILGLSYVISWALGPVIMWELARLFDRKEFWRRHVVAGNWADFWIIVLPLPIKMLFWNRAPDDPQAALIGLLIVVLSQVFAGYLLVKTMEFRVSTAVALTLCLFMISIAYTQIMQALLAPFMVGG